MAPAGKPLVWLRGEVKTPPFSPATRIEAGGLLLDPDAIVIADVFAKTTSQTPKRTIENCVRRLNLYDQITEGT
jgi:hypothetical protein